jgi:hypothetical protein
MLYDLKDNKGVVIPDYKVKSCLGNGWPEILSYKGKKVRRMSTITLDSGGYPSVGLRQNGKKRTVNVHQIIFNSLVGYDCPKDLDEKEWKTFSPQIKEYISDNALNIDHINDNRLDFRPHNLQRVGRTHNLNKRYM